VLVILKRLYGEGELLSTSVVEAVRIHAKHNEASRISTGLKEAHRICLHQVESTGLH